MATSFDEAMDNDLNISKALAALFDLTKKVNPIINNQVLDKADVERLLVALKRINQVLGVLDLVGNSVDKEIEVLIFQRDDARKSKDWKQADNVRSILFGKGIQILDTQVGPIWNRIHD